MLAAAAQCGAWLRTATRGEEGLMTAEVRGEAVTPWKKKDSVMLTPRCRFLKHVVPLRAFRSRRERTGRWERARSRRSGRSRCLASSTSACGEGGEPSTLANQRPEALPPSKQQTPVDPRGSHQAPGYLGVCLRVESKRSCHGAFRRTRAAWCCGLAAWHPQASGTCTKSP